MVTNKLAFNVKPLLTLQFIQGFNINIHTSLKARLLSKVYSIVLSFAIITPTWFLSKTIPLFHLFTYFTEYFLCILVFLFTNDGYLSYFSYIPTIDKLPGTKKQYRKLEIFSLCSLIATFAIKVSLIMSSRSVIGWEYLEVYTVIFVLSALETCKIILVLFFGLLYLRINAMKKALHGTDFTDSHMKRSVVIKFIQMYETLVDTLENVEGPLKLLAAIGILRNITTVVYEIWARLLHLRKYGTVNTDIILWLITSGPPILYFILIAIALDLTDDNLKDMRILCMEKIIQCNNERDRCCLQQLLLLLQHRPLRFTILRINPLHIRTILSSISFCIINIIAVLQIKSFYT